MPKSANPALSYGFYIPTFSGFVVNSWIQFNIVDEQYPHGHEFNLTLWMSSIRMAL